jgi:hypothetical protein
MLPPLKPQLKQCLSSKKAPDIIYRVALRRNGEYAGGFYEPDVFIDEMERLGFAFVGRGEAGGGETKMLDQPFFNGLVGPFWGRLTDDGRQVILYEDHETYRICSL